MPPKAKFTKEEIINCALKLVENRGFEALTARSLADELGSSPRPIFTVFKSMTQVEDEVTSAAKRLYESYEDEEMSGENAFKGSGIGYIRFAAERPKLFRLLFMKEREILPAVENVLNVIDGYSEKITESVIKEYGFGSETAKQLYLHMWIYSHGIATLLATKVCSFTKENISDLLTDVCSSIIAKYKNEGRK